MLCFLGEGGDLGRPGGCVLPTGHARFLAKLSLGTIYRLRYCDFILPQSAYKGYKKRCLCEGTGLGGSPLPF